MKSEDDESKRKRKMRWILFILFFVLLALLLMILLLLFLRTLFFSPQAFFTYYPPTPLVGENVTFNASSSYDPDGMIVNYTWNFGDGNTTSVTTPITYHVYNAPGRYIITLVVTDNDGLTGSESKVVNVERYPITNHPIARFTYSPQRPTVGESVRFDASASTPNGGQIVIYEWNFGNGEIRTTSDPVITHVYTEGGIYNVTLTVIDSEDLQDSTWELLNVVEGAKIDVYTQYPYPYGGQGLNRPSDAFAPQDKVVLSAIVTFEEDPLENKLVSFMVYDPSQALVIHRTVTTASNGIAITEFTVPWQREQLGEIFGNWSVYAFAEVVGNQTEDTLSFQVGWLIEIVKLETTDYDGNPETSFAHDEKVNFNVYLKNIAMTDKNVNVTITVHDELNVPTGLVISNSYVVPANTSIVVILDLVIPKWAAVGDATAYANAFSPNGSPYCPSRSASFSITGGS